MCSTILHFLSKCLKRTPKSPPRSKYPLLTESPPPYKKDFNMINKFRVPPYSKWTDFPVFVPDINYGYVIRCYDGDTITIVSNPYGELCRFTLRISGLDTPELKGSTALEKSAAEIVRDELKIKISNKYVRIKIHGNDKYGRLLADIWLDEGSNNNECSINKWLLDNKYALPYDGGKKSIFQDEFLMAIMRKKYNRVVKNQSKKDVNDNGDVSLSSDNSL